MSSSSLKLKLSMNYSLTNFSVCLSVCLSLYIYMYRERERERGTDRQTDRDRETSFQRMILFVEIFANVNGIKQTEIERRLTQMKTDRYIMECL